MNASEGTIALIVVGLFGVITGIVNKGIYLGFGSTWWNPSKETKQFISLFLGGIALFIGLALLRKQNL